MIAYSEKEVREKFPKAYDYIKKFENELHGREKGRMNIDDFWFSYIYPKNLNMFDNPKIMTREISLGCNMTYDEKGEIYHNTKVYSFIKNKKFNVDDKFYLAILNSSLMWFFLKNTGSEYNSGYYVFKTNYLKPFPLPEIPKNADEFIAKADLMLTLNQQFQTKNDKMLRTLTREFELTEFSKSLQNWHLLSFKDFVKELEKKKVKLSLAQKSEWEEFFMDAQKEILSIQTDIDNTDTLINQLVYELYGLSDDEILIVEKAK